ncbi:MAG: NUDIX domain-containing protein, partial [Anaerolineae bacterium]|nr:NUDIX domain-containing protein [Anaerolineae bacterium]
YQAAGGVVLAEDRSAVLLLVRSSGDEVRLPKGHVEPGESVVAVALREVREESGYDDLEIVAPLGQQLVSFCVGARVIHRTENYFLMRLRHGSQVMCQPGEAQFSPCWVTWEEALTQLTFEAEREWVRRARTYLRSEPRSGVG